jgi:hypothetical protein
VSHGCYKCHSCCSFLSTFLLIAEDEEEEEEEEGTVEEMLEETCLRANLRATSSIVPGLDLSRLSLECERFCCESYDRTKYGENQNIVVKCRCSFTVLQYTVYSIHTVHSMMI